MINIISLLAENKIITLGLILLYLIVGFKFLFRRFRTNYIVIFLGLLFTGLSFYYPIIVLISVPIMFLFIIIKNIKRKPIYVDAEAVFEGGGIRRGLTPPEVSVLLKKPFNYTISIVLLQMVKKNFIKITNNRTKFEIYEKLKVIKKSINIRKREILRREYAQQINKVITPYEEILLEFLEINEGVDFELLDFSPIVKPFLEYYYWRIGGYDYKLSREYYRKIISRSYNELRAGGVFIEDKEELLEHNLFWILIDLSDGNGIEKDLLKYFPSWLDKSNVSNDINNFNEYIDYLKSKVHLTISQKEIDKKYSRNLNSDASNLMKEIGKTTYL